MILTEMNLEDLTTLRRNVDIAIKLKSEELREDMRTVKVTVAISVKTTKTIVEVKKALESGIYRGLDGAPNHVAQPKDVAIKYV